MSMSPEVQEQARAMLADAEAFDFSGDLERLEDWEDRCFNLRTILAIKGKVEDILDSDVKAKHLEHKALCEEKRNFLRGIKEKEKEARESVHKYALENKKQESMPEGYTFRKSMKYEVTDGTQVPREFLSVDRKKVKAYLKKTNGAIPVKGLKFSEKSTMVVERLK